jgi:hypothetical protein
MISLNTTKRVFEGNINVLIRGTVLINPQKWRKARNTAVEMSDSLSEI